MNEWMNEEEEDEEDEDDQEQKQQQQQQQQQQNIIQLYTYVNCNFVPIQLLNSIMFRYYADKQGIGKLALVTMRG